MSKITLFQINKVGGGVYIPPKVVGFSPMISDLDLSGDRSLSGLLHRERVAVKRACSLDLGPLTVAEMSQFLTEVKAQFVNVTYFDAEVGGPKTGDFYIGDREPKALAMRTNIFGVQELTWAPMSVKFAER
jgi:hypothetical protein